MTRSIIDELFDLNREMNRIFSPGRYQQYAQWPETNVYEGREEFVLVSKVPGIEREAVSITVKDNSLTVSGKRQEQVKEGVRQHLKERFNGEFSRTFKLNESVDVDKIKAETRNGLLIIKVPRKPEAKPRKIEIQ